MTDASMQQFIEQVRVWWLDKGVPIFYPIFLIYDVLLNGRIWGHGGEDGHRGENHDAGRLPIGYNRALLRWLAARLSDILFFGYILIGLRRDKRGCTICWREQR